MDAYIGEIRAFGFNYVTEGWLSCNGQTVPVLQYQALYAVIGNAYGGDTTRFALPNLIGAASVGAGAPPSSPFVQVPWGGSVGAALVTLTEEQMPAHNHTLYPGTAPSGGTNYSNYTATPTAGCMLNRLITDVTSTNTSGVAASDYAIYRAVPPSNVTALAPQSISPTPTPSVPGHENCQPYQVFNFMINYNGQFPDPD